MSASPIADICDDTPPTSDKAARAAWRSRQFRRRRQAELEADWERLRTLTMPR
jgi:hypothetical protein